MIRAARNLVHDTLDAIAGVLVRIFGGPDAVAPPPSLPSICGPRSPLCGTLVRITDVHDNDYGEVGRVEAEVAPGWFIVRMHLTVGGPVRSLRREQFRPSGEAAR